MLNGPAYIGAFFMFIQIKLPDLLRRPINLFPDQFLFHRSGFLGSSNNQIIKLPYQLCLCVVIRRNDKVQLLG